MNFIAVDVETANERMSSICQVGIVEFREGVEISSESILVDPQEPFSGLNTALHGIDAQKVSGAQTFRQHHPNLSARFGSSVLVCHSHFDRTSFGQACALSDLQHFENRWLDTLRISRRAWPDLVEFGYGLGTLSNYFQIELHHHDAVSDARCAGLLLMKAVEDSGLSIEQWFARVEQPIDPRSYNDRVSRPKPDHSRDGNEDGRLYGELVVFTGSMSMIRTEAADLAHDAGAAVANSVTKKTTILVVGDQDPFKLNGNDKSEKHRKAESLLTKGANLRIMTESDFVALLS